MDIVATKYAKFQENRPHPRVPGTAETPFARVSALDLPPVDLGRMLRLLGTREQWYDEMLEERV